MMEKVIFKPTTALLPVPTVMVTSSLNDETNIITIAWTGIMNSQPPMVYIGVNPIRHSHHMIKDSGEYVINVPSVEQAEATDYCGIVSGKNVDKFQETGLTPLKASYVKAPLIAECPVNLECRVQQVVSLGSHDVFIAEILAVHYNKNVLKEDGRPDMEKIKPYGFCGNEYRLIGEKIGSFGYSRKN